jgi:hypothetical protein
MRQIRQSRGTRLQVVCLTYIYLREQRDEIFLIKYRRQYEQGAPLRAVNSKAPFGNHEG